MNGYNQVLRIPLSVMLWGQNLLQWKASMKYFSTFPSNLFFTLLVLSWLVVSKNQNLPLGLTLAFSIYRQPVQFCSMIDAWRQERLFKNLYFSKISDADNTSGGKSDYLACLLNISLKKRYLIICAVFAITYLAKLNPDVNKCPNIE